MNESFLYQMRDSAGWLMLDPVVPEHTSTVVGLCLVFGLLSFRKTVQSLGASNWRLPMAVISYALGGGAMIAGLAAADIFLLPQVPKEVPFPAYAGSVLVMMLLAVAAPIGKLLMKCSYAAAASAWVTALMVSAAIVFFADLGFTHYGPPMARVMDLKGTVSYRLAKGAPLEEIQRRRIGLPVGAEIVTKADSSVTLNLGEDSFLAVRPLSLIRIVAAGEATTLELDMGRVIGSVQHTSKTKFKIRTPAATSSFVGADFSVLTDGGRQTFVTVASGKINVTSTKSGAQTDIGSAQSLNCPSNGSPTPPRRADAAELKSIESFKTAVSNAKHQRHQQIDSAL